MILFYEKFAIKLIYNRKSLCDKLNKNKNEISGELYYHIRDIRDFYSLILGINAIYWLKDSGSRKGKKAACDLFLCFDITLNPLEF